MLFQEKEDSCIFLRKNSKRIDQYIVSLFWYGSVCVCVCVYVYPMYDRYVCVLKVV